MTTFSLREIDDFYFDVRGFVVRYFNSRSDADRFFEKYPSFLAGLWYKAENGLKAGLPAAQVALYAITDCFGKTPPKENNPVKTARAARARMWQAARIKAHA